MCLHVSKLSHATLQDGNVDGEWRTNPHVQSYVLATDQASWPHSSSASVSRSVAAVL